MSSVRSRRNSGDLDRAQAAITAAGYVTDPLLWLPPKDSTVPVAAECEHSEPPSAGWGDCGSTGPD
ncbi:hypothetical protein K378_02795 [Streptomyces sp. Amel2xB2]|nr:hypothetical protein K378_02795 [Streptomyces sp. Amel2xB2]